MARPSLQWLLACVFLWCVCGVCIHVRCSQERTHIFVNEIKNRKQAQIFCKQHHVSLSSILSEADHQKLLNLEQKGGAEQAWIGLYLGPQNWTWTDGSKPAFYNWRRGGCAAVFKDGIWVTRECKNILPFICETHDGRYDFETDQKTWEKAKEYCAGSNRKLATFKTASSKPESWPESAHWMGLEKVLGGRRPETGGAWKWVDEEVGGSRAVLNYSNWRTVKYCGLMSFDDGEWKNEDCHVQKKSVCSDGHKYAFTEELLSWHKAQEKCQDKNMSLISIHNGSQNADLRGKYDDEFWIGLYDSPWRWPNGISAELQYWDSGQPCTSRDCNLRCVTMKKGLWDDVPCSESHPFFCLMKTQEKLNVTTSPSSWEEALLHCRGLGGDLASVGNHSSQMLIQQVVQAAMTTHVWVGLRFLGGEWLWVNSLDKEYKVEYTHWAPGRQDSCPLHHCGAIERSTGYWKPRGCEEKLDFLCQLP